MACQVLVRGAQHHACKITMVIHAHPSICAICAFSRSAFISFWLSVSSPCRATPARALVSPTRIACGVAAVYSTNPGCPLHNMQSFAPDERFELYRPGMPQRLHPHTTMPSESPHRSSAAAGVPALPCGLRRSKMAAGSWDSRVCFTHGCPKAQRGLRPLNGLERGPRHRRRAGWRGRAGGCWRRRRMAAGGWRARLPAVGWVRERERTRVKEGDTADASCNRAVRE
jgi:hypothetical protein